MRNAVFAFIAVLAIGCAHATVPPAKSNFTLTSPAFREGESLPETTVLNGLDCSGPNRSPALQWSNAPANTQGFVVLLDDYEARLGDGFIHWCMYDIPGTATGLPENAGAEHPEHHAWNDFLKRSYGGPCPPEGPPHKYRFTVYAIDLPSIDDAGTPMTWRKLRVVIHDHVLAKASLTGLYGSAKKKELTAMTTEQTIASLDTQYQAAVEKNDAAAMDRILADDFVLVIGSGKVFTKKDLLDEARSGHIVYEHQRDTNQTVRVYGDTAVVTALLSAKGTDQGAPFAYRVWFSDTYVRMPDGWRYAFGQSGARLPAE
ncbi:MAG TPA: YbhB/YbcL family Raf kinase inhibitor-like protein [Thermoanaerobaculia bacterium]|nr:YbhB/YbcL family Raf kinase inhibitor-like protein [Thermoanaerobaculia bacterium]